MILPEDPAPLRRSTRVPSVPSRLTYTRDSHGRILPGHSETALATFPFPDQPIVPSFPPVIPDIGSDPLTYKEAVTSPDSDQWQMAIQQEHDALMKRKTWVLVPLPAGRKTVRCKWVFKKKMHADGTVVGLLKFYSSGSSREQTVDETVVD